MIVKMKKIFMVVQDKDMFSTLESLCAVGVVHVEHHQRPSGKEISSLKDDVCCLERVVDTLSQQPSVVDQMDLMPMQHQGQYSSFGMIKKDVWEGKAEEILGLVGLIAQYEENLGKRQIQINQWEAWGNFDPEDIEMLEKKGFYIRFVEVPENKLDQCPEGVVLEKIFARDGIARCLAISREEVKLPFTGIPLLPISLEDLKNEQEHDAQRIVTAEEKIAEDVKYSESFKNILSAVKEDLMFHQVYEGRGSEVSLSYIKGFCPEDKTAELQTVAQKGQWGLLVEDPAEDDKIPTMLKNPKWVNFIKPVFDFINIVPGYKEVDISMFFLIFFSIFVGMLIGDAGYGMLFLLLTGWTQATTGKKVADKTPFFLVYVLCGCIIGWGVLTGTFFGQQWLPSGTFQPVLPWLKNNENIQMFCFLLGAVHLSVAHVWRAIMKAPSIAFLSEVGWLA
ncbi:MAG: hypothetical protein KAJ18_02415, partial [Candidatus Omnitrophica bacterium]|nr:hypothetical protein [Candidatus Omnitrophota bacterium]